MNPPKRSKRRKIIAATIACAVLAFILIVWWPFPQYDIDKVHPLLKDLKEPYRKVESDVYLDGGSVHLAIEDAEGNILNAVIQVEWIDNNTARRWEKVNIILNPSMPQEKIEVRNPRDSKNWIIRTIDRYARNNKGKVNALIYSRGAPKDFMRGLYVELFVGDDYN
jgi:hypothetical protein